MTAVPKNTGPGSKKPRCPLCSRPSLAEFKPFCSKRCQDEDLGNWLTHRYAIPSAPEDDSVNDGDDEPIQ